MQDGVPPIAPDSKALAAAVDRVRAAIAALRQGAGMVLCGAAPLLLLAAEMVSEAGLAWLAACGAGPARLVLTGSRGATVMGERSSAAAPVALWLSPSDRLPEIVRGLSDPTAEQVAGDWVAAPVPDDAGAALALAKLARLLPAVVVAPLTDAARADWRDTDWRDLAVVTPGEALGYQRAMATELRLVSEAVVPLEDARDTRVLAFRGADGGPEHLAVLIGRPETAAAPLARVHSECFTGDVLGSLRCDCGPQLRDAIRRMAQEGCGVLLYLAQEGRGIGIANKLRAYALQDRGLDTIEANRALGWEADERSFLVAAGMLQALGIVRVRLLTNNPEKVAALAATGIAVERHSLLVAANGVNDTYLATKATRFGHLAT